MERKREFLLLDAIRLIIKVLPPRFKVKAALNLFYIFLNSLLELLGIAFLIPLLVVILDEEKVNTNFWLQKTYTYLGFQSNASFIVFLSLSMLVFTVAKNIGSILLLKSQYRFSFSIYRHLSLSLFKQYYGLGLQHLRSKNSNRIVNHITSVSLLFAQNVINSVSGIINESIVFFLFLVGLLLYEPGIILLMMAVLLPFILGFFGVMKKKVQHIGKERNAIAIDQNRLLYETFQGYVDIEIRNMKNWIFNRFSLLLNRMNVLQVRNALYLQLPLKFIETVIVLALVCIICFSILSDRDVHSIATLLGIFAVAAYRLLPGINRLMNYFLNLRNHRYTFEIVGSINPSIENKSSAHADTSDTVKPIVFKREIKISDVCFSFDGKPLFFEKLNLTISKGEILGIIGSSGSGKSTLLNIILRFYKESEGSVLVDGMPLSDEDIPAWRNLIGYVPQDVFIFDGSLLENITLGSEEEGVDFERLHQSLKQANLAELISGWEDGLYTQLGERGGKLSGGQRQRLGIARALYKGAEILIFDEATSALDMETEEDISNSIKEINDINKQLTLVIIAHRYTTLRNCGRIIELSAGKIARELTFETLVQREL